jgi:hypothetical protein
MRFTAPEPILHLLSEFVRVFRELLSERLTGVYLHGSLAMGCFNPVSSDVDLLVVVREPLGLADKESMGQVLLRLSEMAPANGMEMSVITVQSLRDFHHPCPYELHFSEYNKADYAAGRVDFNSEKVDPDLAAHLTVTRARGVCLYGAPVETVFPPIPVPAYLDSIAGDADWSYTNILRGPDEGTCRVPVYGVLNFCRVLAYVEVGVITSKAEGGQWGLEHTPLEYHPVIAEALNEYLQSGSGRAVDARRLKAFAGYANDKIHPDEN